MINFSQSYITWLTHSESRGRFNIESVCNVSDTANNSLISLIGLSGVMACDVYGKAPLFYNPSYFYHAVITSTKIKIFRTFYPHQDKDTIKKIEELFSDVQINLSQPSDSRATQLTGFDKIVESITLNQPFTAQIRFRRDNYNFELLFPVKHINSSQPKKEFQVETGPIVITNFESNGDWLSHCNYSFVAFNNFTDVNFLVQNTIKTEYGENLRYYNKLHQVSGEVKLWTY